MLFFEKQIFVVNQRKLLKSYICLGCITGTVGGQPLRSLSSQTQIMGKEKNEIYKKETYELFDYVVSSVCYCP
jgi:hypothetical protein